MNAAILVLHWLAGVIVLAEALNKLERTCPLATPAFSRAWVVEWLKAIAWALLAVGGAGAMVTPLLPIEKPTLQDATTMLGFAVLIVRTRIKEG